MTTKQVLLLCGMCALGVGIVMVRTLHAPSSSIIISHNPSKNFAEIGRVPSSTHAEIDTAIAQARAAQATWAALPIIERIAYLRTLQQAFIAHKDEIGALASQEMGMPIQEMGMPISVNGRIDIDSGLAYMDGFLTHAEAWLAPDVVFENATEIHTLFFEPRGVLGAITAWNYPFCNFIWSTIPALVTGNTVVFKHSEECMLTAQLLERIVTAAGLPDHILMFVHGTGADAGAHLMDGNIDMMMFTGSTTVGKKLYELAGKKFIPAVMELGGSAAGIVCADADIDLVVESVFANRFVNSGQVCDGLKRLIVDARIFDEVASKLQALLATKKVGDASDPSVDIGPLVSARQLATLEAQVADAVAKGARIVAGGKRPEGLRGAYYEPTIIVNVTPSMSVWREEVFGPVLPVVPFATIDEAIALANDTVYGLGGYIYTKDAETAAHIARQLVTGNISVNGTDYVIAQDPFGGCKNSGVGREHGKHGLRELCTTKLVATKR